MITFIDTSGVFGRLSRNYKNATFIAIQNGRRISSRLNSPSKNIIHEHYFCFGQNDIDLFDKWGYNAKQYHPIGSLRAGISTTVYNELNNRNKYDICLISIWRPMKYKGHYEHKSHYQDLWDTFDRLNQFLCRYINDKNVKLCIAMRSALRLDYENAVIAENEENYWKKIFNGNAILKPNDMFKLTSYKAVQESRIVIGVASTLILEAFGMGKKILYCDFTGNNIFHDYNSSILFRENNYDKFAIRLNELRSESNNKYVKRNKKYAGYLMNNDLNNPPHIYIRNLINEYCL